MGAALPTLSPHCCTQLYSLLSERLSSGDPESSQVPVTDTHGGAHLPGRLALSEYPVCPPYLPLSFSSTTGRSKCLVSGPTHRNNKGTALCTVPAWLSNTGHLPELTMLNIHDSKTNTDLHVCTPTHSNPPVCGPTSHSARLPAHPSAQHPGAPSGSLLPGCGNSSSQPYKHTRLPEPNFTFEISPLLKGARGDPVAEVRKVQDEPGTSFHARKSKITQKSQVHKRARLSRPHSPKQTP